MGTIQFADRGTGPRISPRGRLLAQAAVDSRAAPSIFNSQPWRWRISDAVADLRADRTRLVTTIDPDGRLLTLSCGAALHHACTALEAAGYGADVVRFPDPADPDLLATVRVGDAGQTAPGALRLHRAMFLRHTDRRPFAEQPVPGEALERLRIAAGRDGVFLYLPRPSLVIALTTAASHAATTEISDPAYRAELASWVHNDPDRRDGVPIDTTTPEAARPVPIRNFAPATEPSRRGGTPAVVADRYARYAIVATDGDSPRDWLVAGEALSAVLLQASVDGLATSPMSDLVETPATRLLLRDILGNVGHPAIVVRIGLAASPAHAATPRRAPDDTIETVNAAPASGVQP